MTTRGAAAWTRRTLASPVRIDGVGLFTGAPASVEIAPAERGGIVFETGSGRVEAVIASLSREVAHPAFAQMPPRNTTLAGAGGVVHTVEHLMAALAGLGVTDAVIRTGSGELPIGDGSSGLFVDPVLDAGLRELSESVEPIRVTETMRAERDGASVTIEPADRTEYIYRLDYGEGSPVPPGEAVWDGSAEMFASAVAPARTFCLRAEAEAMHAMGLFEHLTPRDMLVFGEHGPIENTLRFPDEPARHKLLDLIGDLALAGRPVLGRVVAERSGHALNHEAAGMLASLVGV